MKKRYIILAIIIIIILAGFVLGEESFVFEKDADVDLKIPVYHNNNSKADTSISCAITVRYPNESLVVEDQDMTFNSAGYFNYTLNSAELDTNGDYPVSIRCDNGADFGFSTFIMRITPSGNQLSTAQTVIYIVSMFFGIFFFILTLYVTIKLPWFDKRDDSGFIISVNHLKWLKLVLGFITYLIALFLVSIMNDLTSSYLILEGLSSFFNILYIFMLTALVPVSIILPWVVVMSWIINKRTQKALERGVFMS